MVTRSWQRRSAASVLVTALLMDAVLPVAQAQSLEEYAKQQFQQQAPAPAGKQDRKRNKGAAPAETPSLPSYEAQPAPAPAYQAQPSYQVQQPASPAPSAPVVAAPSPSLTTPSAPQPIMPAGSAASTKAAIAASAAGVVGQAASLKAACPAGASEAVLAACTARSKALLASIRSSDRSKATRSVVSTASIAQNAGAYAALTGRTSWGDSAPVTADNAKALSENWQTPSNDPLAVAMPATLRGYAQQQAAPRIGLGPSVANAINPAAAMSLSAYASAVSAADRAAAYGNPAASKSEVDRMVLEAEQEFGIPPGLLSSIVMQESGGGPNSHLLISCRGASVYPKSKEEAIAAVNSLLAQGKLDCDLATTQRNMKWHPRSFLFNNQDRWHDFFDHRMAIRWGAWYLRLLAKGGPEFINDKGRTESAPGTKGDWLYAVLMYNAWYNEKAGYKYLVGVVDKWSRIRRQRGISEAVFQEVAALSPNGVRVLRLNDTFQQQMLASR
jgi:hypothetical protein